MLRMLYRPNAAIGADGNLFFWVIPCTKTRILLNIALVEFVDYFITI